MMSRRETADTLLAAALAAIIVLAGCTSSGDEAGPAGRSGGSGKLVVATVNYPLSYFAARIGGDAVDVRFPAPADEDPAYWTPDAATVSAYQQADLILLNGAGYAGWTDKVSLPSSKLVNTATGIADDLITEEHAVTHTHGPGGEHEHGSIAFTTWLDPNLAVEQARAIRQALTDARPEAAEAFAARFLELKNELLVLDERIAEIVAGDPSRPLAFSHPVYQYFIRRYQLDGHSVHWEPDEAPDPRMWDEFVALVSDSGLGWMIWEGEPLAATVDRLTEIGLRSAVFAPCGNRPVAGDYLAVMNENIAELARVYE